MNENKNNKEEKHYLHMQVYKFSKSETEIEKPTILLKSVGKNSIIWTGTMIKKENTEEIPAIINIDSKEVYFYKPDIEKTETRYLVTEWLKNNDPTQEIHLTYQQQADIINKFREFTDLEDPYQMLKEQEERIKTENPEFYNLFQIENENEKLIDENYWLTNENELLKNMQIKDEAAINELKKEKENTEIIKINQDKLLQELEKELEQELQQLNNLRDFEIESSEEFENE